MDYEDEVMFIFMIMRDYFFQAILYFLALKVRSAMCYGFLKLRIEENREKTNSYCPARI